MILEKQTLIIQRLLITFLSGKKKNALKTKTAPNEALESCRPSWQLRAFISSSWESIFARYLLITLQGENNTADLGTCFSLLWNFIYCHFTELFKLLRKHSCLGAFSLISFSAVVTTRCQYLLSWAQRIVYLACWAGQFN